MRSLRVKVLVIVAGAVIALSAAGYVDVFDRLEAQMGSQPTRSLQSSEVLPVEDQQPSMDLLVTPTSTQADAGSAQEEQINSDPRGQVWGSPVLRVGQDFALKSTDTVGDVVVVFGSTTIDGFVDGDVVVCLGSAQVSSTGVIRGSLLVIGGNATVASGAVIRRDLTVIGGLTETATGFLPGGQHLAFGAPALGDRLRQAVPWMTRGLLLGRPIVPDLPWVWWVVGLFLLVHVSVNAVFHDAVGASAETMAAKPLSAFLAGLLVLLLLGPLSLLLVMSVIGILVVPFALCAVVVAWVIGKVAVARIIGARVVPQTSAENRLQSMRSFLLGTGVITILYMIPIVGFMSWAIVGVFGLGSAALACVSALRRENPEPPRRVTVAPPPLPPSPPSLPSLPREEARPTLVTPSTAAAAAVASAGSTDLTSFPPAPFLDRLAAFALDLALVLIVTELLGEPTWDGGDRYLLFVLVYYVGFWTWKGTTVGGIICNLRVVRLDGMPLRFVDAVVRGLSGVFSIAALGLGGFWILRDPERQAWHDKISATAVVKVPRNWPLP